MTLTIERYGCTASFTQTVETGFISLHCPANIATEATSTAGAQVVFDVSAASSFCAGPVTVECAPPSGSVFPNGRTVVKCVARDDCGTTSTCSFLVEVGDWQMPGDTNQDGITDISDCVALVTYLFLETTSVLPCDGGTNLHPGNISLLDGNGSGVIDLADAVYELNILFLGGRPPVLGVGCIVIAGCPPGPCVP